MLFFLHTKQEQWRGVKLMSEEVTRDIVDVFNNDKEDLYT